VWADVYLDFPTALSPGNRLEDRMGCPVQDVCTEQDKFKLELAGHGDGRGQGVLSARSLDPTTMSGMQAFSLQHVHFVIFSPGNQ